MNPAIPLSLYAAHLSVAFPFFAADHTIVVLPLDVSKTECHLNTAARTSLEEDLHGYASDALAHSGRTALNSDTLKISLPVAVDPNASVSKDYRCVKALQALFILDMYSKTVADFDVFRETLRFAFGLQ